MKRKGVAAIATAALLVAGFAACSGQPSQTAGAGAATASPAAPVPAQTSAATTPPPAPPAPPAGPKVLFEKAGNGDSSTPKFTTGGEWQVQWSFDCGKLPFGGKGSFLVNSDDYQANIAQVDVANGSDTTYVHDDAGTHYLKLFTNCDWTLKVLG